MNTENSIQTESNGFSCKSFEEYEQKDITDLVSETINNDFMKLVDNLYIY